MLALLLLSAVAINAPASARAHADAVAWIYVAAVDDALAQLEASSFAPLLPALLPAEVAKALRKAKSKQALAAWYGPRAGAALWLDAGAAQPNVEALAEQRLRALGLAVAGAEESSAAVEMAYLGRADSPPGALCVATERRLLVNAQGGGLAVAADFRKGVQWADDAPLVGAFDFSRLYRLLARSRDSATYAAVIDELGLGQLRRAEVSLALDQRSAGQVRLSIERDGGAKGVFASLGPPTPVVHYFDAPKILRRVDRISVRPGLMLTVVQRLFAYLQPLRSGLVRAQLENIEQRLGSRLIEEALGNDAQTWTLFELDGTYRPTWAAALGAADGMATQRIVEAAAAAVPSRGADSAVVRRKIESYDAAWLSSFRLAVAADRGVLYVAPSVDALALLLRNLAALRPSAGARMAEASGWIRGDAAAAYLLAMPPLDQSAKSHRAAITALVADAAWSLSVAPTGASGELHVRAAPSKPGGRRRRSTGR